jgi:hypothetical protein
MAELNNANNPEALEATARMLRITAAVRANHDNIHLSAEELYRLHPSRLTQTQHFPPASRCPTNLEFRPLTRDFSIFSK